MDIEILTLAAKNITVRSATAPSTKELLKEVSEYRKQHPHTVRKPLNAAAVRRALSP